MPFEVMTEKWPRKTPQGIKWRAAVRESATRDWARKEKGVRSRGWREAPDWGSDAPADHRAAPVNREAQTPLGCGRVW